LVALPRQAVAAACEGSLPLLEGEQAECDGVLVGPDKLARLLVEQALARANAKLVEVDRFSWSAWLTGLGVGAAVGVIAGLVAAR
jgi:hypothetical protein